MLSVDVNGYQSTVRRVFKFSAVTLQLVAFYNLTYVSLTLANNIASYSFSSLFSIQAPVSVSSHLFTPRLHH